MDSFKKLMGRNLNVSEHWDRLEVLYFNFLSDKEKKDLIPKKIHQVWLGEMPVSHKNLIPKIIKNHPEWEYKLWTWDDLKNYPMKNRELFDSISNLGSKSDIARYEILYNEGGVYLDSDFEMVTNFDSLLSNEFFTGCGHIENPEVFNGLIGCTKNNKLMGLLLDGLKNKSKNGDIMHLAGPYYFSSIFFDYIKENMDKKIVVLPTPYFYPLPASERFKIRNREKELKDFIYSFNSDKTICIHLWYNSWQ
jgi:mannosyltransferase OCH1-like enzyme